MKRYSIFVAVAILTSTIVMSCSKDTGDFTRPVNVFGGNTAVQHQSSPGIVSTTSDFPILLDTLKYVGRKNY